MLRRLMTFLGIVALGLALAGCDKCRDWPWTRPAGSQICTDSAPR